VHPPVGQASTYESAAHVEEICCGQHHEQRRNESRAAPLCPKQTTPAESVAAESTQVAGTASAEGGATAQSTPAPAAVETGVGESTPVPVGTEAVSAETVNTETAWYRIRRTASGFRYGFRSSRLLPSRKLPAPATEALPKPLAPTVRSRWLRSWNRMSSATT
jgi:hypothetical protein